MLIYLLDVKDALFVKIISKLIFDDMASYVVHCSVIKFVQLYCDYERKCCRESVKQKKRKLIKFQILKNRKTKNLLCTIFVIQLHSQQVHELDLLLYHPVAYYLNVHPFVYKLILKPVQIHEY